MSKTSHFAFSIIFVILFVSSFLTVASAAPPTGEVIWQNFGSNSVFDPAISAYYPTLAYDTDKFGGNGSAYYYKMWYSNGSQIGLAESDDGESWSDSGLLSTLPTAHHPYVIYDQTGFGGSGVYYKMWFWDTGESIFDTPIGYADSTDGVTWNNRQLVFGGTGGAGDWNRGSYGPAVVLYNSLATNSGPDPMNYSYVMYYDGTTGSFEEIGLATSTDGVSWTRFGTDPVLPRGGGIWGNTDTWDSSYAYPSSVVEIDGIYRMWYSGGRISNSQGIGYAESTDGYTWTKGLENPLKSLGGHGDFGAYGPSGSWNETRNYTPVVLFDINQFGGHGTDAYYKMWRSGQDSGGNKTIGLAFSTPPKTGANTTTLLLFASILIGLGAIILKRAMYRKQ